MWILQEESTVINTYFQLQPLQIINTFATQDSMFFLDSISIQNREVVQFSSIVHLFVQVLIQTLWELLEYRVNVVSEKGNK